LPAPFPSGLWTTKRVQIQDRPMNPGVGFLTSFQSSTGWSFQNWGWSLPNCQRAVDIFLFCNYRSNRFLRDLWFYPIFDISQQPIQIIFLKSKMSL